jgi:hypothetical protein
MPGDSGVTVVSNSCAFLCTRGRGRSGRPAFPAPSWAARRPLIEEGGTSTAKLVRNARRDRRFVFAKIGAMTAFSLSSSLRKQGPISSGACACKQRCNRDVDITRNIIGTEYGSLLPQGRHQIGSRDLFAQSNERIATSLLLRRLRRRHAMAVLRGGMWGC